MARVLVLVDPGMGMSPSDLVKVWSPAPPAAEGPVVVEAVRGRVMLPGVLEVLVLPVAVNLASSALFELVRSWVTHARGTDEVAFEVVESTDDQGNRVVIVRPHRTS